MKNEATFDQFLLWLGGAHSKATVQSYRFALYSLKKYLLQIDKPLVACDLNDLSGYIQWLENRGLRSGTRALYVTALRTMWGWLHKQNRVPFPETLIPAPPATDKESHPFLEPDEYRSIMDQFDPTFPRDLRNKAIVAFLYNTGLRLSEMLSLNVADVDLAERKALAVTFKRKNHKREVYWDQETNQLLSQWLSVRERVLAKHNLACEALFISMNTAALPGRLEKSAVQRMFRHVRKKLGMEKRITAHSCRHGFGYRGVRNNANLRYLQIMMGHATIKTTQQYMGWKQVEIEEEFRRIMEPTTKGLTDAGIHRTMPAYAEAGEDRTQHPNRAQGRARVFRTRYSEVVRHPLLDRTQHHNPLPEVDGWER